VRGDGRSSDIVATSSAASPTPGRDERSARDRARPKHACEHLRPLTAGSAGCVAGARGDAR
jgi:hypothetical protein